VKRTHGRRDAALRSSGAPGASLLEAEEILRLLRRHGAVSTRQLASRLGVGEEEFDRLVAELFALQDDGLLVYAPRERGRVWDLIERSEFRVGRLGTDRRGAGYVRLAGEREDDVFVPPGRLRDAFAGDKVLLRLTARARGERLREGRVVEVLERSRRPLRGVFRRAKSGGFFSPDDPRAPGDVFLPGERAGALRDGERVLVRLLESRGGAHPEGEVVVELDRGDTLEADLASIAAEFDLPGEHGPEVIAEAARLPPLVTGAEWPGRRDFRALDVFTIDPIDARDFDDAISLEALAGGKLRLGVHIADVSCYVASGSLLDDAAAERGTSVYLPGKVLPMLPARLSEDLCSLRPGEDRLTKSVLLTYGRAGELERVEVCRSVIHSRRRFTYEEVQAILDELEGEDRRGAPLPLDTREYAEALRALARLRDRLKTARQRRGALFLDIPKLRVEVGPGGAIEGIGRDERDAAHELIEEFMLAANEAVATYFVDHALPLIGRAHAPPDEDKLADFRELLEAVDLSLRGGAQARDFQRLVDELAKSPLSAPIQLALLRTMPHAEYVPGAALHFALATNAYCHFTSPIRRYPDLIVHQVLDEHLDALAAHRRLSPRRKAYWEERIAEVAPAASSAERRAESAERAMQQLGLIRYLEPRLGEEMEGSVASVHPFGFVVRIEGLLIEGIVHVSTLDAYYELDPHTQSLCERRRGRHRRDGRRFRLGQRVRVVLAGLDPSAREIRFRVV
jgi:ribonuclease R